MATRVVAVTEPGLWLQYDFGVVRGVTGLGQLGPALMLAVQPIPDRAPVQGATGLVREQHR